MSTPAYLEFDGTALFLECVTSESSEHTSVVTDYAVEEGANVADHVRPENARVTLEVFVSNTPLTDLNGWYGGSTATIELDVPKKETAIPYTPGAAGDALATAVDDLLFGKTVYTAQVLKYEKLNVVKDVFTRLEEWRLGAVRGRVVLPWADLDNMVIVRISPNRTASTGDAATMTIELQQIRVVSSALVTAPVPTEVRGKTAVRMGRQPPTTVPMTDKKMELLKSMLKAGQERFRGRKR